MFCFYSNQQEQDWFWILYSFQFQLNLIIPIMQPFQIFIIWMELLYWIFLFDVFHSNGQLNFFWRFFSIIYIPTILHTCFNEHSFIYVNWIESWIVFLVVKFVDTKYVLKSVISRSWNKMIIFAYGIHSVLVKVFIYCYFCHYLFTVVTARLQPQRFYSFPVFYSIFFRWPYIF